MNYFQEKEVIANFINKKMIIEIKYFIVIYLIYKEIMNNSYNSFINESIHESQTNPINISKNIHMNATIK